MSTEYKNSNPSVKYSQIKATPSSKYWGYKMLCPHLKHWWNNPLCPNMIYASENGEFPVTACDPTGIPIPRGVNNGGHMVLFPKCFVGGQSILHPQYFDDGVALTCEYLSEGFEFSSTVQKKVLKSHTRHKSSFYGGPSRHFFGLVASPRTGPA